MVGSAAGPLAPMARLVLPRPSTLGLGAAVLSEATMAESTEQVAVSESCGVAVSESCGVAVGMRPVSCAMTAAPFSAPAHAQRTGA
jgi:hypothetical protein